MSQIDKGLIRLKSDERIIHQRRIEGKWQTIRKIELIKKPFGGRKFWFKYMFSGVWVKTGSITKTSLFNQFRKLTSAG